MKTKTESVDALVAACREVVRTYDTLKDHDNHATSYFFNAALTRLAKEHDALISKMLANEQAATL